MADTITTKKSLQLTLSYTDGSTGSIIIDNPKDSVAAADIDDLNDCIVNNNILLGNSNSTCTGITQAESIENEKTKIELSE
ncbi:MAG: DUF2922 family protein [Selenomonadaceae bacterium]|nr:DUF2922 family protein [Selenomonadaceae bacterium]